MIKNLIVATATNGGIGCNNAIPFTCVQDIKRFASLTKGSAVIMGRKTWESLGCEPLKDRLNIIVSASGNTIVEVKDLDTVAVVNSIENALKLAEQRGYPEAFFIGGSSIYSEALKKDLVDMIYLTIVRNVSSQAFDRYFQDFYTFIDAGKPRTDNLNWTSYVEKSTAEYTFINFYRTRAKAEHDRVYFDLLRNVLANGKEMPTRVGPAISIFDASIRFDMRQGLPILTTKKMAFNAIKTELCWFLKGCKNIKYLNDRRVHIWDKDAYSYFLRLFERYNAYQDCSDTYGNKLSPEYFPLEHLSFERFMELVDMQHKLVLLEVIDGRTVSDMEYTFGDVGPIYGAQWLNFNNSGINQIDMLINTLRRDPTNRRMIISAWNPEALIDMALPPCHYAMEFYTEPLSREHRLELYAEKVGQTKSGAAPHRAELDRVGIPKYYLSMRWIQRSCDTALGVPFDITSYAILLSIISSIVNMIPKELIGSLGNVHIYKQHEKAVKRILNRNPYLFSGMAKLHLPPQVNAYKELEPEMIQLENYKSYPAVEFELFTDASKQAGKP